MWQILRHFDRFPNFLKTTTPATWGTGPPVSGPPGDRPATWGTVPHVCGRVVSYHPPQRHGERFPLSRARLGTGQRHGERFPMSLGGWSQTTPPSDTGNGVPCLLGGWSQTTPFATFQFPFNFAIKMQMSLAGWSQTTPPRDMGNVVPCLFEGGLRPPPTRRKVRIPKQFYAARKK